MSDQPVEVRNAADPKQVKGAATRARSRELRLERNLREVMSTQAGRFVMWDMLGRAGVYRSVWDSHGTVMARNVGRQDLGHELMALLISVDEGFYQEMEREARARARADASETEAAHTAPAGART